MTNILFKILDDSCYKYISFKIYPENGFNTIIISIMGLFSNSWRGRMSISAILLICLLSIKFRSTSRSIERGSLGYNLSITLRNAVYSFFLTIWYKIAPLNKTNSL